jgi:hypothetical protein
MSKKTGLGRAATVSLLLLLPLSGCFKSDTPLISVFDSVAPIPEGQYTYVNDNKTTNSVIITHDCNATKLITIKADGSVKISTMLMVELDKGYYIVMDPDHNYTLIRVNPNNFIEFDGSKLGDKLLAVAQSAGKNISDYGIVRVTGDDSHTCWFDDLDGMKRAFAALANSGTTMSDGTFYVTGLVIAHVYHPQ